MLLTKITASGVEHLINAFAICYISKNSTTGYKLMFSNNVELTLTIAEYAAWLNSAPQIPKIALQGETFSTTPNYHISAGAMQGDNYNTDPKII